MNMFKKLRKGDLEGIHISKKGAVYRTKVDMDKLRNKFKGTKQ